MATTAATAVEDYLVALKNPSALRDDKEIEKIRAELDASSSGVERLRLHQRLLEADSPSIERYEEAFITHAQAWAGQEGITVRAFQEEGVPNDVLRRAGFKLAGGRRARASSAGRSRRKRVTSEEVRQAMPAKGTFTIKDLQERSGASPAVVRKVVNEEEAAGAIVNRGSDPDHRGPGRAPSLYARG